MRATISDIAREAKCSITSVSLVLNNKRNAISEEKRQEIRRIAQRLNYCVNRQAAALVTKKTNTVGLIIPDNCNSFFSTISKQIETYARNMGYNVIYGNSDNKVANDCGYVTMFRERNVDGLMIVKSASDKEQGDAELAALLSGVGMPVVVLDRAIEGFTAPTYTLDNARGGYLATRYLLEQGHRRIGCYTGPLDVSSACERLAGYRQALEEKDIPFCREWLFEGDYQLGREAQAFSRFEKAGVTAVFAHNDMMAFGLYRQIQLAGKSIPGDYSIVGFDDLEMSSIITPGLTTIRQPLEELSRNAITCLIAQIEEKREEQSVVLPLAPTLVIRDSVRLI